MEKFKNILEIMWDIVKAVFIILLMIIGIKLILLFIMPISIFSLFPYSPFDNYDWNPITTIIGAIITGLITWFAVYKTSELDNKARKEECKYKFYMDALKDLDVEIRFLSRSLFNYFIDNQDPVNIRHRTGENLIEDWFKTNSINKIIKKLETINDTWKIKKFSSDIQDLKDIQQLFNIAYDNESRNVFVLGEEKIFTQLEENHLAYSIPNMHKYYKQNYNKIFDYKKINKAITDMQNLINKEFKLEDN